MSALHINAPGSWKIVIANGLVACCGLVACGKRGSGKSLSETRKVAAFNQIRLSGSAKLDLRVDPEEADGTVILRGDDDVVPNVTLDVENTTLNIKLTGDKSPNLPLEVSAVVADLQELRISGAASGTIRELDGERFTVRISGAASLDCTGRVDDLRLKLSGAPKIDATKLIARTAEVSVSGAGKVDVTATERLEASISGAGSVVYGGNPKKVEKSVSGVGTIKPR